VFGKRGRPHEDRLLRQREIFDAVAPLVLERGARGVTMRDAARAAYLSIGGLYHYFPTKRDLLLHALSQEALDRFCADFLKSSYGLKADDPQAFLDIYAEFCAQTCLFARPAAQAAVELGTETFWPVLEASIQNGLDNFLEALARVTPHLDPQQRLDLAQAIRRVLLSGLFDRSMTADDIRTAVRTLVQTASATRRSQDPDQIGPPARSGDRAPDRVNPQAWGYQAAASATRTDSAPSPARPRLGSKVMRLNRTARCGSRRLEQVFERARQDSNLRPSAPEADALSTELQAREAPMIPVDD
jgi:AcrR family transcriptional regulator